MGPRPLIPAFMLIALTGAISCTVQQPMAIPPGSGMDPPTNGQKDLGPTDNGPPPPPVLDAIEQITAYPSVPVHGSSRPGTNVLITDASGNTITASVESSSRFCLDVMLLSDQENNIQLQAIDGNGRMSDPVFLTVQQSGTPPTQPPPPTGTSQNAALSGSAMVNHFGVISAGPATYVNDGNPSSAVEGHYASYSWGPNPNASVVVQLNGPTKLSRIHVIAPQDCPLSAPLNIMYSSASAPSSPDVQPMAWQTVMSTISGDMLEATAMLNAVTATSVAVMWPGQSNWNCGNVGPYYGLAELEAWTAVNVQQPPPPPTHLCASGG
jgi:hypothetical protein